MRYRRFDSRKEGKMNDKDWTGNSHSVFVTNGASNHSKGGRAEKDYYATDPIAIDKLLQVYKLPKNIWECACGEGHLAKRLAELGYNVKASDLVDRGYGEGGVDFLFMAQEGDIECILTNPPYKYAVEFVENAIRLLPSGGVCAMFLRTLFLEGKERRMRIFNITPPHYVFVFSERVKCAKNGEFDGVAGVQSYSWFIWEKDYHGETIVKWI
jgi:hypothetical protein